MNKSVVLLPSENYLAMIKNSIGSKQFQNLYALIDGDKKDITEGGYISCAYYVTSILVIFKLIDNPHSTVEGSVKALKNSGWDSIREPKIGSIVVWGPSPWSDKSIHKHIGFYIGEGKAISNSSKKHVPHIHDLHYGKENRPVEGFYWHPSLGSTAN